MGRVGQVTRMLDVWLMENVAKATQKTFVNLLLLGMILIQRIVGVTMVLRLRKMDLYMITDGWFPIIVICQLYSNFT